MFGKIKSKFQKPVTQLSMGTGYDGYTSYSSGSVSLARRLDYRGVGDWENWTDYDIMVGDPDGPWGTNCKAKPLCGTVERTAVANAIAAGRSEVVETPEQTPDAAWGVNGRYNQVIRITEDDGAGGHEDYYFLVSFHKYEPVKWDSKSYGSGKSYGYTGSGGDSTDTRLCECGHEMRDHDSLGCLYNSCAGTCKTPYGHAVEPMMVEAMPMCEVCGKAFLDCLCTDAELVAAGICPMCGDRPSLCLCPKEELDLSDAEIESLLDRGDR